MRYGSTAQRIYSYDSCPGDAPPNTCAYSLGRPVKVEMTAVAEGVSVKEFFSYHQSGAVKNKTLRYLKNGKQGDLTAGYTWNGEGRLATQSYPNIWEDSQVVPDVAYTYSVDAMGRPNRMQDASWADVVSSVQYGVAGELPAMSWMGNTETRTYNSRLQLRQITNNSTSVTYNFPPAPGNNGRIASEARTHLVPWENETINYSYDSSNREVWEKDPVTWSLIVESSYSIFAWNGRTEPMAGRETPATWEAQAGTRLQVGVGHEFTTATYAGQPLNVHELLHYTGRKGDSALLSALNISNPNNTNPSVRLTEWLPGGCR